MRGLSALLVMFLIFSVGALADPRWPNTSVDASANTEDASKKEFGWQRLPVNKRTGVRLMNKDGSLPIRAKTLQVSAPWVHWRCAPSNCGSMSWVTSADGNLTKTPGINFRAPNMYQFGVVLYQIQTSATGPTITVNSCKVYNGAALNPGDVCTFDYSLDIFANVNDVVDGQAVYDGNNYAYDDNHGPDGTAAGFSLIVRILTQ